jgi:hypothetical protein
VSDLENATGAILFGLIFTLVREEWEAAARASEYLDGAEPEPPAVK